VEHGSTVDHATDDDGEASEITVTVGLLADGSGFFVEDDGVGVPDADRESVFEAGETGSGSGSGLGLAIVRRIAQAHGWTVDLTDSDTGGARFEFRT
jgi:signal transduction histidine kinase